RADPAAAEARPGDRPRTGTRDDQLQPHAAPGRQHDEHQRTSKRQPTHHDSLLPLRGGLASRDRHDTAEREQRKRKDVYASRSVRGRGLEPPLLSEPDPKSGASTSSAILAWNDAESLAGSLVGVIPTDEGPRVSTLVR